jgi:peptide-methionine (R)-S-oxide reductase
MTKNPLSADRREHAMTRRQMLCSVLGLSAVAGAAGAWKGARAASPPLPSATVKIEVFSADGKSTGVVQAARVTKTEAQWRAQLSPEGYAVTRQAGTERAFSGEYWDNHATGLYRCVESGTGWPSFWKPVSPRNVVETVDSSLFMQRTAVSCRLCDAHLGHVFDDGPRPTGLRYCMNSVSLKFYAHA